MLLILILIITNVNCQNLRISTFHCPPFMILNENREPIDGIEYHILRYIARDYNITYATNLLPFADPYNKIRYDVIENISDICACSLWMKPKLHDDVDFSTTHSTNCITFFVPKPKPTPILVTKTRMEPIIIIYTLIIFIISAILLKISFTLTRNRDFSICLLELWRAMLQSATTIAAHALRASAILLITWYTFTMLITTAYNCGLTTMLTTTNYDEMITSTDIMIAKQIHWSGDGIREIVTRKFYKLRIDNVSRAENNDLFRGGNFAMLTKKLSNQYVTETTILHPDVKNDIIVMPSCIGTFEVTFYLNKHLDPQITLILNKNIQTLKEHGLIWLWYNTMIDKYTIGDESMRKLFMTQTQKTMAVPLDMQKVSHAFFILLIFLFCAFLVFLSEIFVFRQRKRRKFYSRPQKMSPN